ncbi:LysR family transcriptional regulator [Micromonospora sp. NPDC047670]|uniref:LysR family transcriptional regulator n=1 Tax=Micromonospora sp. NPDC047670 TaxID=3364252 RepID=UPI00371FE641
MELRHLRYFLAVAEHLHFGRAAEALGIRQPPLSQQIRALEEELGVPLFERSSRHVALTAAGEAFRDDARLSLAHAEAARLAARRVGRGDTGEVALGYVGSATLTLLPQILRRFRDRYPDVALALRELTTTEQARALRAGNLDVGLLRPPLADADAEALRVEPVGAERLIAALPAGHPLAHRRTLNVRDLAGQPFVLSPRELGPGLHDQILDYCRRAGFTPRVTQEAVQMQSIVALVGGGLGVSLVPASVSRLRRADVVYRPLQPATRVVHLAAARRHSDGRPTTINLMALTRDLANARLPAA